MKKVFQLQQRSFVHLCRYFFTGVLIVYLLGGGAATFANKGLPSVDQLADMAFSIFFSSLTLLAAVFPMVDQATFDAGLRFGVPRKDYLVQSLVFFIGLVVLAALLDPENFYALKAGGFAGLTKTLSYWKFFHPIVRVLYVAVLANLSYRYGWKALLVGMLFYGLANGSGVLVINHFISLNPKNIIAVVVKAIFNNLSLSVHVLAAILLGFYSYLILKTEQEA